MKEGEVSNFYLKNKTLRHKVAVFFKFWGITPNF